MNEKYISVTEIAREHSRTRQVIHKVIKRLGIKTTKMKAAEFRGQAATHISVADYESLVEALEVSSDAGGAFVTGTSQGVFYLIQLEPEFDPQRIKVGFATDVNERLRSRKTSAPMARLVKHWPCKMLWEKTAIDCITEGAEQLHTEVFRVVDIEATARLADNFFELMPDLSSED